jgi:hypothetical protein
VKQLQQFLDKVNFYRRFPPDIASMLQPLTESPRGDPEKLFWMLITAAAFNATRP